jgi:hypothetical protein
MNTNTPIEELESEIAAIKQKLLKLGPMHPGSVSRQYQVCGNPACKCMHPKKPQKHGPYHKLSYVYRGKPVCRFVRAACVDAMNERLAIYKEFRSLMDQWIELSIQRGMIDFFAPISKTTTRKPKPSK